MKKKFSPASIRGMVNRLESDGKTYALFVIGTVLLMVGICIAVFFVTVKGAEEVMVPQITGKDLAEALMEMQAKELYPKIVLRYTDNPDDKNKIMEQSPAAGAIVKAGKRINLTVSRGISVDKVNDFTGQMVDEVRTSLKAMFASTKEMITVGEILYTYNEAAPGTVLEQDPLPGTLVSDPIALTLVVSRGAEQAKVAVPSLAGLSIDGIYDRMRKDALVYNFTVSSDTATGENAEIVSQSPNAGSPVEEYSRVETVIAFPERAGFNPPIYGVFSYTLQSYSYPLQMQLEAVPQSGASRVLVSFSHPGGSLTIPYAVEKETSLVLSVQGKEVSRIIVR